MRTRLTYIFLLMMAAGTFMASCSSESPDDGVVAHGSEMQFEAIGESRSSTATNLNYEGSQFAIFGDMKSAGSSSSSQNLVVFSGTPVSYNSSKWVYANLQYWFPNFEYSFVALHPANPAGASHTKYSNSNLSFNYTLPEAFRDTPDLLFATHRRMYEAQTSSPASPVMLKFTHALSRVNFLVKCDGAGDKLIVKEIGLKGINKSGTLTVNPASLTSGSKQTDDYELSWADFQNNETLLAALDVEVADGSECPLFPDNDALFVIPQPDNKGIIMQITYTVTYKNGKTEERTLTAETRIGGWQPGKVYTYSLSISSDTKVIDMNVSVNDWKEGTADNVTVPRK